MPSYYSKEYYNGDGSTDTFTIPCPYISTSHIKVKVGGVEESGLTFPTASTVQLTSAPAAGSANVLVYRETPKDDPLVDFEDGSIFAESDLDLSALQAFYIAQETLDELNNRLPLNTLGSHWDAGSKRIQNVAAAVDDTDAVNKGQMQPFLDDAEDSAADAAASATAAAASATSAATSATNAANSATSASTSASSASTSASTATNAASSASTSATNAASSASSASTSATNAANSATSAASSATTAMTQASSASSSASSASTSASTATTQASNASTSATNAANSATSASTSASSAATSATSAAEAAASVNLRTVNAQTGNYTVVAGDRNKLIEYTGSGGHTIDWDPATLGAGFEFHIKHNGSGNLTLDPSGATTIDGATTQVLTNGQAVVCVVKSSTVTLITQARGYGAGTGTVTSVASGTGLSGGPITSTGTLNFNPSSLSSATLATGDKLVFVDISNSNNPKIDTVSSLFNLLTAPTKQIFTSSATWTKPTGCRFIHVIGQACGGDGGSCTSTASQVGCASGGGAGGYGEKWIDVTAITSETVTISNTSGGTSSFGSHITLTGGPDGSQILANGTSSIHQNYDATGGTSTGGDINVSFRHGGVVYRASGTVGSGAYGNNSMMGIGGRPGSADAAGSKHGIDASGYGAGGGGGVSRGDGATGGGGLGGDAIFIVEEFY